MIKTIQLLGADGELKEVPMKCDAALPRAYRANFGEDVLTKIMSLTDSIDPKEQQEVEALELEKQVALNKSTSLLEEKEKLTSEIQVLKEGGGAKSSIATKEKKLISLQKEFDESTSLAEKLDKEFTEKSLALATGGFMSDLDVIENMAYIFATQANPTLRGTDILDWLGEFDGTAFYVAANEIIGMYFESSESTSIRKKK